LSRQSTGSEKDWLDAARTPPAEFTSRSTCSREDLFRELDFLVQDLGMADKLLNSAVRRRVTRIRALASTLIPKQSRLVCGYEYADGVCGIEFASEWARAAHQELIHDMKGVA
jgi:hypothetical protein